jgi:hypothetical protein
MLAVQQVDALLQPTKLTERRGFKLSAKLADSGVYLVALVKILVPQLE